MEVLENQPLSQYVSMRLGGPARFVVHASTERNLLDAAKLAKEHNVPILALGDGTNVIFDDNGFNGVVVINGFMGIAISETGLVTAGSGENWDNLVNRTVAAGLAGIEALSLVPGTVGGAPVNNIGAYGQEIRDTLVSVRAFDTQTHEFVTIPNNECAFEYRTSRFKASDHGRFIITEITLQLHTAGDDYAAPTYQALVAQLEREQITRPTIQDVRNAVIAIRTQKLPDPKVVANSGSFFKNAIVDAETVEKIKALYPDVPVYAYEDKFKIPAGWLIEAAGLKNSREHGMWVYDKQALVLVNESATSFTDLQAMANHISETVYEKFGIELITEPELL